MAECSKVTLGLRRITKNSVGLLWRKFSGLAAMHQIVFFYDLVYLLGRDAEDICHLLKLALTTEIQQDVAQVKVNEFDGAAHRDFLFDGKHEVGLVIWLKRSNSILH